MQDNLAVPDWQAFKRSIVKIFESVRSDVTSGAVADYIPILAKADPSKFGLSVCTVDGQRFDYGDFDHEFSMQCVHTPIYIALCCAYAPRLFPAGRVSSLLYMPWASKRMGLPRCRST